MEEMKQTGVQWMGEIPSTWNTKRIKYMATLKGRIGWQGLTSEEYQDEGAYLITGVDFANGGIDWDNCVHVPMKRWEEATDIQIEEGDLLITKDGTIGKVAIVTNMPGETSLNSAFSGLNLCRFRALRLVCCSYCQGTIGKENLLARRHLEQGTVNRSHKNELRIYRHAYRHWIQQNGYQIRAFGYTHTKASRRK